MPRRRLLRKLRTWAFGEPDECAVNFSQFLRDELEDIEESRRLRCQPPLSNVPGNSEVRARDSDLFGLALSGGGIRSATFCLGVLQALASAGLLVRFDYLSTVSGGGYIGSWLATWIKRSHGGVFHVQESLKKAADGTDAAPIEFLRDYSNYLAPRTGFFSTDTWTVASVWLRNTLLNQVVILLFFAICLLMPRLLGLTLPWLAHSPVPEWSDYFGYVPAALAAALLLWAMRRVALGLQWFTQPKVGPEPECVAKLPQQSMAVTGLILVTVSWMGAAALSQLRDNRFAPWVAGLLFSLGITYFGWSSGFEPCFRSCVGKDRGGRWRLALAMTSIGSGLTGTGLTFAAQALFRRWAEAGPAAGWYLTMWGGPCFLLILCAVALVQIGLMGRWLPDDRREWWSRLGAWLLILMTGCFAIATISIYGPLWTAEAFTEFPKVSGGITLAWVGTTIGGILTARSGKSGGQMTTGKADSNGFIELAARVAPYVAIPGFLIVVAAFLHLSLVAALCRSYPSISYPPPAVSRTADSVSLQGELSGSRTKIEVAIPVTGVVTEGDDSSPTVPGGIAGVCQYHDGFFPGWRYLRDQHWRLMGSLDFIERPRFWHRQADYSDIAWIAFFAIGSSLFFMAWRIDVNEFSLHHFYKNRLVRCYLGASSPHRDQRANPFTGFSSEDDVTLASLRPGVTQHQCHNYVGPSLIINSTLNFSHGDRLAYQERKAASFVFTPRYCGFDAPMLREKASLELDSNGYRRTDMYAYPQQSGIGGIHVGTAMAISGAAASPNMGYHTSSTVAFFLTLFNVRLGWWLGNPRHPQKWKRSGPVLGLLYLLNELAGSATSASDYVYISDGGHFENLGIYELVRRKCRLVVACDSEEDKDFHFGGLGNAIRKCRIDLGVDIVVDIRPMLDRDERGRTASHILVGAIDYHDGKEPGILLYVKSSLVMPKVHTEPTDVLEYAMREERFPHQSTGDQFFDESQFESYRRLGMHIGEVAVDALKEAKLAEA